MIYSPFRYPGGKSWFVPEFKRLVERLETRPSIMMEPFCGGASVGLAAQIEGLMDQVILVEKDENVAAVWRTILSPEVWWLVKRIAEFDLTLDSLQEELAKEPKSRKDQAFQTILRNRTNHGGVLAPGAGTIKTGDRGQGVASRWNPHTLTNRLLLIQPFDKLIQFAEADGLKMMHDYADVVDLFYIDPPYTEAGKRLYKHHEINHDELFDLCDLVPGNVIMTYDDCPEIRKLAEKYGFKTKLIPMKTNHHTVKNELVITSF